MSLSPDLKDSVEKKCPYYNIYIENSPSQHTEKQSEEGRVRQITPHQSRKYNNVSLLTVTIHIDRSF